MQKLELNSTCKCKIFNNIEFEGISYYILLDSSGNKHLLENKYFTNYNHQIGKTYNFRIDKINCKGKYFFEPEHPNYKIGKNYDFYFVEKRIEISKKKKIRELIICSDNKGVEIEVSFANNYFNSEFLPKQKISAKVIRIKKGVLIIEFHENKTTF